MDDASISILIVDDKPDKVLSLEAVLGDRNRTIVRAYSGREALRHVLNREFAVILLDVNMPDMDGFETAAMIRQRRSSAHVPIIFLTAMSDEMHAARGYSLGAVDYILTPVVPEVLRSKVAVFVDLFRKNQQVRFQAERLRQRASQLHQLTGASLAINSASTVQSIVQIATRTARDVIAAGQAATIAAPGNHPSHAASFSLPDESSGKRKVGSPKIEDHSTFGLVCTTNKPLRMSGAELSAHELSTPAETAHSPLLRGLLAVPLTTRDGRNMGLIELSGKQEGEFTDDDEAILVQLAQMASVAIENVIYAEEREANRLKDEFLSTLSHELRTPLNAISGWIHLLKLNPTGEDIKRGLQVIDQNVKSQTKLIEDLLDLSRIATGKLRVQLVPVSFRKIVDAAIDALRPVMAEKRIGLDARFDEGEFVVRGDSDRLQQVLTNLLGNAVKFTPAGGRITAGLSLDGGVVQCRINDTGIGISPEFLPYVFDRFRQADSSSSRHHGGLGIGLTIVQQIVELHGGTVRAASEGKGRGSTFTVQLPLAAWLADKRESAGKRSGGREEGHGSLPSLRGIHVLLVDDDPDAREVVAELLARNDAEVISAGSASEALSLIPRHRPTVLVTDLAMPEQDGFELLRRMRALPQDQGGNTPAIALTAYAQADDEAKALSSGFCAHLSKPVNPGELIHSVLRCLKEAEQPSAINVDLAPPQVTESPDARVEIPNLSTVRP